MPWCEPCSKFFNASAVATDGLCPECGRPLDEDHDDLAHGENEESGGGARIPWHFWVGVIAMVIYLGWRLVQGIIWAIT